MAHVKNTRLLSWKPQRLKTHWNLKASSGPQASQFSTAWYFTLGLARILEISGWLLWHLTSGSECHTNVCTLLGAGTLTHKRFKVNGDKSPTSFTQG